MWGRPPFTIADNRALNVRNLDAARNWYKEKPGLYEVDTDRQEDSGQPFVDLQIAGADTFLSLVESEPGMSTQKQQHVIFFAKNLGKAHEWLGNRGIAVEPITNDSAGNRLFRFRDLDGNSIEVCVES